MEKKTLQEIADAVFDLECEARKNSTEFLINGDNLNYMYWRGKRAALSDISIVIDQLMSKNK